MFLIPGDLSHLAMIAQHIGENVSGILLHQRAAVTRSELAGLGLAGLSERTFNLQQLHEVGGGPIPPGIQADYANAMESVFADSRVHYLATRSRLDSPFNNSLVVERIVLNSLRIIRRLKPSCLVASSTPHSLEAWVFAKCFESCGLPVYILEATPIAFRAWMYRGLDSQVVVSQREGELAVELSRSTAALVKAQRESTAGMRDEGGYKVSRIYLNSIEGSDTNTWWSTSRELRWLISGKLRSLPIRLNSMWRKRKLLHIYGRLAITAVPPQPFVVYFMHYQPERSSLPVGLAYGQQWMAIRALASALPPGWKLLVREHPTTWLRPLDPFVRTSSIYADIASLKDTHLCSMDIDTFELIDRSAAVATLTGSVGFQSLVRGKPVLAMGLAPYKDHPACYRISSIRDAAAALEDIASGGCAPRLTADAMDVYLRWVERNSVCADPAEQNWIDARLKNFAEIYRGLLQGKQDLNGEVRALQKSDRERA